MYLTHTEVYDRSVIERIPIYTAVDMTLITQHSQHLQIAIIIYHITYYLEISETSL